MRGQTVTPTWGVSFDTAADLEGFTIIDANGDGHVYENILRGGWSWLSHEEVVGAACYYYDNNNDADDWLITPGLNLSAGRSYTLSLDANAANIYPERFEVLMGDAPTVEAMTSRLINPTVVNRGEFETFSVDFEVAEAGVYYIGIHAISDRKQYILDIKNLLVEAGLLAQAPSSVTDLSIIADPTGAFNTAIDFSLPTVCNDGTPLVALTRTEVRRGETIIAEYTDKVPGEHISLSDAVPAEGAYTYTIIAYNEHGDGAQARASVWVGFDAPAAPVNPHIVDKFSSIDIVWEQPEGRHGGLIKKSDMSYYIYNIKEDGTIGSRLATVDKGKLSYNVKMNTQTGEQSLLSYIMVASNSKGLSPKVETKAFLVGKALSYPFAEHFTNRGIDNFWWVSGSGLGFSNQYAGFYIGRSSADAGEGSLLFEGFFADDVVTLHSAKVSLQGATQPWLTFSHKAMTGTEVKMQVIVCRPNAVCDTVMTIDYRTAEATQWTREICDLSPYLNERYVTLEFRFENMSDEKANITYLDDIQLCELPDYDLAVSLEAAEEAIFGQPIKRNVTVTNLGSKPVTNYRLISCVKTNNQTLDSQDLQIDEPLLPMQKRSFAATCALPGDGDFLSLDLQAEVMLSEGQTDATLSNNSANLEVTLIDNPLPQVASLNGACSDAEATVSLSWEAPVNPAKAVTESFEDYQPWLTEQAGDWLMLDEDYGLCEQLFQGYYTGLEDQPYAFTTFNLEALNPGFVDTNEAFTAHTGKQCMAAFFCHDGYYNYQTQDNWLISPLLSGAAQRISLYACNYDADAPETFEILVSKTDTDPASFTAVGTERRVNDGQWHPFTANLPTGSRYFAIHHTTAGENAYMLKVDDISYTQALTIDHYNVYRDGLLLGATTDCTYTVSEASATTRLAVSAVYIDGSESAPVVCLDYSGIRTIENDAALTQPLYRLDGIRVTQPGQPGIYVKSTHLKY